MKKLVFVIVFGCVALSSSVSKADDCSELNRITNRLDRVVSSCRQADYYGEDWVTFNCIGPYDCVSTRNYCVGVLQEYYQMYDLKEFACSLLDAEM